MKPIWIAKMNLPIRKIIVKRLSNKIFYIIQSTKIVAKICSV